MHHDPGQFKSSAGVRLDLFLRDLKSEFTWPGAYPSKSLPATVPGVPQEIFNKGWGCGRCLGLNSGSSTSLGRKRQWPFRLCLLALCCPWHIPDKDGLSGDFPANSIPALGRWKGQDLLQVLRNQFVFSHLNSVNFTAWGVLLLKETFSCWFVSSH